MRQYQDWREGRRFRALELSEQGWGVTPIARALGVTKGAVSQWLSKARARGPEALRTHFSPGPTPRLAREELARLPALLERGPEAYGFHGQLWTRKRVAEVLHRELGVRYSVWQVGRLLRQMRYSPQKPLTRPAERKEGPIQAWREAVLPALRKK